MKIVDLDHTNDALLKQMKVVSVKAFGHRVSNEAVDLFSNFQDYSGCRDFVAAVEDGKVVGYTGLCCGKDKKRVWLSYTAVDPDHQGKHIGKKLLKAVEQRAKKRGYKWLFIETYSSPDFDSANVFYQKNGYKLAGKIENACPDGADNVYYVKELNTRKK